MTTADLIDIESAALRNSLTATTTHLLLAEEAIQRASEALWRGDAGEAAEVLGAYRVVLLG